MCEKNKSCQCVTDESVKRLMAEYIYETTGACPLDMHDWERASGCANICNSNKNGFVATCWIMYFEGISNGTSCAEVILR